MHATFYAFEWDEQRLNAMWEQMRTSDSAVLRIQEEINNLSSYLNGFYALPRKITYDEYLVTLPEYQKKQRLLQALEEMKESPDTLRTRYLCDIGLALYTSQAIYEDEELGIVLDELLHTLCERILHIPKKYSLEDVTWEQWIIFFRTLKSETLLKILHDPYFNYAQEIKNNPKYTSWIQRAILDIFAVAKKAKELGTHMRVFVEYSSGDLDISSQMAKQRLAKIKELYKNT